MLKRTLFISLISCFAIFSGTYGQAQEKRLIETSENTRAWMTLEQVHQLSAENHMEGPRCPGFMDVTDHPEVFTTEAERSVQRSALTTILAIQGQPKQQEIVQPLLSQVLASRMLETVKTLSDFENRLNNSAEGVQAAEWIKSQFIKAGAHRSDTQVDFFNHKFQQPSVVAQIKGEGPLASEIVVIGAHEDSINSSFFDKVAPGADDNASGTSTVLEIYRVLAQSQFKPKRTLHFITYAGEEKGLLGSQDIAAQYKKAQNKVVGAMQFDMTMFPGNGNKQITFISDYVDKELTQFTKLLVDEYIKLPWNESKCGYACSDHASWTKFGFASVFPFEAPFEKYNKKIHSRGDLLNILDAEFGAHFARLGLAYAVELSLAD